MNLLRNGLLMRKTEPRRRTVLTEKVASPCGLSAEFITLSRLSPILTARRCTLIAQHEM
jgi:hypothetical protein